MIHAAKARALLGQPLSLMVGAVRAHSDVRRRRRKMKKLFKKKKSDAIEFDVSAAAN